MIYPKSFLLFIFSFIMNSVFCQKNINPKLYYEYSNKAELEIIKNKHRKALTYYKRSLKYLNQFSTDSYNACLCALECDAIDDAIFFASKLVDKGVPLVYFTKNKIFNKMVTHPEWMLYVNTNPVSKIDKKLRNRIDSMHKVDQKYRFFFNRDSMLRTDSLNRIELLKIFDAYGYPSEHLIGIRMRNDSTISRGWSPFDVLMIHQVKLFPTDYIDFFEQKVNEGLAENTVLAMHSKNFPPSDNDNYLFYCLKESGAIIVKVKNERFTCCCKEETFINKNRKRIFLGLIDEQRQKIKFREQKDSKFMIGYGVVGEYTSEKGDEDLKKIKNELLHNRHFILYDKTEYP